MQFFSKYKPEMFVKNRSAATLNWKVQRDYQEILENINMQKDLE